MSPSRTNPPARTLKSCLENSFDCLGPSTRIEHKCCICLEDCHDNDYAVKVRNISGCNHIFGYKCISTWLGTSNTCPMCRAELYKLPRPVPLYASPHWSDRYASGINPRTTSTQDLISWFDNGGSEARLPRHRIVRTFANTHRRHIQELDERRLAQRQMVDEAEQDMQELRRTRGRLYGTMQYYQQRAEALDQSIQRIEAERLELQEINENVNARLDARIHARLLRQERAGG